jgi:Uma2 family endonuclease
MAIRSRPLTYDDLQRLRETRHERLELIDGELFVTPSPTRLHQLVSKRLTRLLLKAVDDAGAGDFYYAPFDVMLAGGSIVQPDLLAVTNERLALFTAAGVDGAPDLVIEISSPSTVRRDHESKRDLYARHNVSEYWLVDLDARTITIFSDPRDARYRREQSFSDTAVSATIPALSVDLAALFAPVPGL